MARWVLKVWNTFFFLKKGRLHWKGKCRQHKNNHVQINILHFITHSQIFTQISCLQVQKGKEPQRIEVTVSSTTFNRVNTVVLLLHLLNPEGNRESIPHVDSAFRSWRLTVVLYTFGFRQSSTEIPLCSRPDRPEESHPLLEFNCWWRISSMKFRSQNSWSVFQHCSTELCFPGQAGF